VADNLLIGCLRHLDLRPDCSELLSRAARMVKAERLPGVAPPRIAAPDAAEVRKRCGLTSTPTVERVIETAALAGAPSVASKV
jgi:hypothetical protein